MKAEFMIAMALMVTSGIVFAQTACPQGVAAGGAQCGPSSLVNSSDPGYTSNAPILPPIRWADRWGAIADDGNGVLGIVTSFPSKRKAKKAAINECQKRGGGACKIRRTFVNQCAAVIAGEGVSAATNSPTEGEAIELGRQLCSEEGGGVCRVYWSGCSHAERIQ
jgi:hypothetical protein